MSTVEGRSGDTAGKRPKRRRGGRAILIILLICCLALAGAKYGPWLYYTLDEPWNLTLVNKTHAVPDDWETELTQINDGQQVDSRMYPYLQEMLDACRADGLLPVVVSSYRTAEDQQDEFDEKVEYFEASGYSEDESREFASSWAAEPGYSEHQLGLAVDIDSEDTSVCSNDSVWAWLSEHCAEYGFILRYPEGKEGITGCSYEPWHYRYVGKTAAKAIMLRGITLEEYLCMD